MKTQLNRYDTMDFDLLFSLNSIFQMENQLKNEKIRRTHKL